MSFQEIVIDKNKALGFLFSELQLNSHSPA